MDDLLLLGGDVNVKLDTSDDNSLYSKLVFDRLEKGDLFYWVRDGGVWMKFYQLQPLGESGFFGIRLSDGRVLPGAEFRVDKTVYRVKHEKLEASVEW